MLELLLAIIVAIGTLLLGAAAALSASSRRRTRSRLRLVVPRPGRLLGGGPPLVPPRGDNAARGRRPSDNPRRAEVTYLRCISGGATAAAAAPADAPLQRVGKGSPRR